MRFTDGELWCGGVWRAVKALDLLRDQRFALHSGSDDPPDWKGDAKVAGRAAEVDDPARHAEADGGDPSPDPSHLFRADISELIVVRLGDPTDHIAIEAWHEGRGVTRERR